MTRRAVVLVSGGLDSATALAIAREDGYACHALSVAYGQRHAAELAAASRVCQTLGVVEHRCVPVGLDAIGGSALTDSAIAVPEPGGTGIPVTYVPARNTVMLAIALGYAEVVGAEAIVVGVNAVDYSGYPDCRPEYIEAFENMARLATKQGVESGQGVTILAPLIAWTKSEIIRRGCALGVDYAMTVSCYAADSEGRACGRCDACHLRRQGFQDAGIDDPTLYQPDANR